MASSHWAFFRGNERFNITYFGREKRMKGKERKLTYEIGREAY
jgi:hypothetical protein